MIMNMDSAIGMASPKAPPTKLLTGKLPMWEPMRLTHLKPELTQDALLLANRQDLWHKFVIFGIANIDKHELLDAIVAFYDHELIIPTKYTVEHPDKSTFIARCSVPTLQRLVKQGLRIMLANGEVLAMDIILGYAGLNEFPYYPHVVYQAVQRRYDVAKKVLDLSNFQNDPSLTHVYCPLGVPKVMNHVLYRCRLRINNREGKLSVRDLNLRSNNIKTIGFVDKFFNYHLTKLDLSHNKIDDINALRCFFDFKITELWLDGNPLCAKYTMADDYIKAVKNVFPHLQKLDGIIIGAEQKYISATLSQYLGNGSRLGLVKQFIKHFFTFYDQDDRIILNGLYDRDAVFSTTLGTIINPNLSRMTKAFARNRNLLKFVDYAKCHEFVLRGPDRIIAALRRQPPTYHNYKKFSIDVMHYGDEYLVLALEGYFIYKEFPTVPMFFNRTFVLVEADDNEYCITNDQYHIQSEAPEAKVPVDDVKPSMEQLTAVTIEPVLFSPTERHQLVNYLQGCTTMNEEYCRRYLEKYNWDIRAALSSFMKAYTVNDVPPEAFSSRKSSLRS